MDSDFVLGVCGYFAVVIVVFVLSRLRSENPKADRMIHVLFGLALVYPVVSGVAYLIGLHQESYASYIYLLLITILMGILAGVTLLVWFVHFSGLWERGFRSSLRTLVLFVLSIGSVMCLLGAPVPRKALFNITGHEKPCWIAFFSDDGQWLVSVSRERAIVWDVGKRQPYRQVRLEHEVDDAVFQSGQLRLQSESLLLTAYRVPGLEKVEERLLTSPLHDRPPSRGNVLAGHGRDSVYVIDRTCTVLRWAPHEWWGWFWYPQFWPCVILLPALIWSIFRDRKDLGVLSASVRSAKNLCGISGTRPDSRAGRWDGF